MEKELSVEEKLREKFPELSAELQSAISFVYHEVVDWHEKYIRLSTLHFQAMRENEEKVRQCLIYLLARDLASGKKVPLLTGFSLVAEIGGSKGWANLRLKRAIRLRE